MTTGSRFSMPRLFAAALCVAILGTTAPASAADLGVHPSWRARHVRASQAYWNWRDRCAYAGYYCLYAEYGYVYHYPFDDRPVAHAYYSRHRYR